MKTVESTFVMNSEKVKFLKYMGFGIDSIIVLKEELGKAREQNEQKTNNDHNQ